MLLLLAVRGEVLSGIIAGGDFKKNKGVKKKLPEIWKLLWAI